VALGDTIPVRWHVPTEKTTNELNGPLAYESPLAGKERWERLAEYDKPAE
jgi:hypothetical protein